MNPFRLLVALLILAAFSGVAQADGFIVVHDVDRIIIHPPHPPHPPVPPRPWPRPEPRVYPFAPLQVEYHHVNITIKDQVAVTEVDQVFFNPNNARLEGEYIFPLPKGAEIDKFSMDINGKQQEAELLDADKARAIYTDIVRKMKDPALMEYADRGMFKVRIFPIEPNSKKQIKIRYTQILKSDSNLVGYTYPLNTEKFSSSLIKEVSVKCTIDSQHPIKTVYSPSHKVEVNRKGDGQAVIGWEVKNAKPDTDFQIFYSVQPQQKGDIAASLLAYNDGSKDGGHFMLFISPGKVAKKQVAKKDIVFVLDTSGSMAGEKMEQARRALKFCIENLNDGDRFEVIRFSTEAEGLFGGMTEVNKAARVKATEFADSLKPIGGTAIEEALIAAVKTIGTPDKGKPAMIIFLTDGRPTIGTTDENQIMAAVKKQVGDNTVRIFSFGVGTDINTHLLDKITEETKAASQYVLPTEDIEVKVSSFFGKISNPVLANVEFKVQGDVRVTQVYPSPLPDVFSGDQVIVMGRFAAKDSSAKTDAAIQLEGYVDGKKKTFTYEVSFPSKDTDNAFVPRLWATRRVGYLLDQIRLHGESGEVKEEVTRLAKQYGIVTPYTSYLILEDEAKGPQNAPRLSHVDPSRPPSANRDRELREEAGAAFDRFKEDKSGDGAVGAAKAGEALKQANTASDLNDADQAARRGIIANARPGSPLADAFGRKSEEGGGGDGKYRGGLHVTEYVAGRTFYFNGTAWIDSLASDKALADIKPVKVKFGSDEYFDLLVKHKDAGKWFALGTQVTLVLDGKVYEVTRE
ncbi:MAG: VIT domain-containing protein [Phycisphaeraceae bacterium]